MRKRNYQDSSIIRRALAGESMLEISREYSVPFEDVFALLCCAQDEQRQPHPLPPVVLPRDGWRVSLSMK